MKRTWTIFILFFAGLTAFSGLQANNFSPCTSDALVVTEAKRVTESEWHILKKASEVMNVSHQELITLYEQGDALIEELGENQYRVTAYVNSGNPLIADIESSL